MPWYRLRRRIRSATRPLAAWLLIVAYSTAALGVPLPLPAVVDPSGMPFPCQAHRCGCQTAEHCWKSCCCLTNREKLAWSAAHNVTPPSHVVVAAAQEAVTQRTPACATRSCCSHKHASNESPAPSAETVAVATPTTSIIWVSALDGGRCRGATPVWQNVPISLPPTSPLSAPSFEPCVRPVAAYVSAAPYCPSFAPPNPPPWMA